MRSEKLTRMRFWSTGSALSCHAASKCRKLSRGCSTKSIRYHTGNTILLATCHSSLYCTARVPEGGFETTTRGSPRHQHVVVYGQPEGAARKPSWKTTTREKVDIRTTLRAVYREQEGELGTNPGFLHSFAELALLATRCRRNRIAALRGKAFLPPCPPGAKSKVTDVFGVLSHGSTCVVPTAYADELYLMHGRDENQPAV